MPRRDCIGCRQQVHREQVLDGQRGKGGETRNIGVCNQQPEDGAHRQ